MAPDRLSAGAEPRRAASLRLDGVTKAYGETTVLHGLELSLNPGELLSLLGPSGCGKTTALRCIAGLETVSSGQVLLGGEDVTEVPVNRRDIGMVFQQYSLFPHLTVTRNVAFGLGMRRVPRAERAQRVAEMLEIVGLGELAARLPHELSGGQQQRVALARALVTRPRALLLDEPLSALDAEVRLRLREQIRQLQTELGITTVFVTHDQEEALAISDRVAVMEAGRIAQLGTPEELYRRPATPFVAGFVGLSNRLDGVIDGGPEARVLLRGTSQGHGASLPLVGAAALPQGSFVTAFVRPEHVRLTRADGATAKNDAAGAGLTATIVSSGFLGSIRRTVARFDDGVRLASQHDAGTAFTPGERVDVSFTPEPVTVEARL